jgi:geranylgeranyl diphosphate synthase type I
MRFIEYLKIYKPKIEKAIENIYEKKIRDLNNTFLNKYYSELKDYFMSGGKRIRPLLTIATYNAFSKNRQEKIIYPSVGVEFLHNASLIHDDIIDKDDFRRGNPAFHYRFQNYHETYKLKKMKNIDYGNSIGIIGGDSAFFLGLEGYLYNEFEKDLNLKAIEYYENAFIDIANGVLIEIDMVNQKNISITDYVEMISLKTGALLEKAILIGANYAQLDEKYRSLLSIYAINLGIVFQMIDDILGTFGDEKVTGKPTDGDIREGKKTCLLIHTLANLNQNDANNLYQLIEKKNISINEVDEIKSLFIKADSANKCKKLAVKYYNEAKEALFKLKSLMNDSEYEFFEDLLDFVMNRNF